MTTNINEFYAAGIGFSIVGCDSQFGDDGELSHCRSIEDLDYVAFDGEFESEGMIDTNELRDDNSRWDHMRDSHVDERISEAMTIGQNDKLWNDDGTHAPVHGEMQFYAIDRVRRFRRLSAFIARMPKQRKYAVRKELWSRYKDSVRICAKNGEWYMLFLTKAQVNILMDALR